MPSVLAMSLSDLELGRARDHGGMHVEPILNRQPPTRDYLVASEAIKRPKFQITEVSPDGSVPSLKASNGLDTNVLLLDGEEFAGAKQNRVVNLSVLVAAGTTLILPVSCVEAGRWEPSTTSMNASGHLDALAVRRKRIDSVTESARRHEGFRSDQLEVWDSIADVLHDSASESMTSALSDAYAARSNDLREFEQAFAPEDDQVGALIAIDGRWTGIELFAQPEIYAAHAGKIIRSNAIAIAASPPSATPQAPKPEAHQVLHHIAEAATEQHSGIGLGTNLRFDNGLWFGSALCVKDQIVHLVAYAR